MRFAHTADIHLADNKDIEVLNMLVDSANASGCTHFLIAGDTFDDDKAGRSLAVAAAASLSRFEGRVWIVPGNHDKEIAKYLFADNTKVFSSIERVSLNGLSLLAIPFSEKNSLYDMIVDGQLKKEPGRTIALMHGTYRGSGGDGYFPVRPGDLERLGLEYAALGHYHLSFIDRIRSSAAANPGSPRITRETDYGRRKFYIYDSSNSMVEEVYLDLPYLEQVDIQVNYSMGQGDILAAVKKFFAKIDADAAKKCGLKVRITLTGYWTLTREDQDELIDDIKELAASYSAEAEIRLDGISVIDEEIFENPMVTSLISSIESAESSDPAQLKEFAVRLISDIHNGRL